MSNIEIIDIAIHLDKIYMICKHDILYYISINNIIDSDLEEFYIIGYTDKDSKSRLHKPISIAINPINNNIAVAENEKGIIKIFSGDNYKFIKNLGGIQRAPEPNSNNSNVEDSEVSTFTRECVVGLCSFVRGFVGYTFTNPINIIYSNDGQYLYILDINGIHSYNFKDNKYYSIYKYESSKSSFILNKLCINNNNLLIGLFDKVTKKYNKIKYILFEKMKPKPSIIEFEIEPFTDFIVDNSNDNTYNFVINTIVNEKSNCILKTYHCNLHNDKVNIFIHDQKKIECVSGVINYKLVFYKTIYYYRQFTNELFKIKEDTIKKYIQDKIPSKISRKTYKKIFTNTQKNILQPIDSLYIEYNKELDSIDKTIQKFFNYLNENYRNNTNNINKYNINVNELLNVRLSTEEYNTNIKTLQKLFHPDKLVIRINSGQNNGKKLHLEIFDKIVKIKILYNKINEKSKSYKAFSKSHNVANNATKTRKNSKVILAAIKNK